VFTLQAFLVDSYEILAMFLSKLKGQEQAFWSPSVEKP